MRITFKYIEERLQAMNKNCNKNLSLMKGDGRLGNIAAIKNNKGFLVSTFMSYKELDCFIDGCYAMYNESFKN